MLKVEIVYWDNTSTIREFDNEEQLNWFVHTEGDAVTSWRVLSETS